MKNELHMLENLTHLLQKTLRKFEGVMVQLNPESFTTIRHYLKNDAPELCEETLYEIQYARLRNVGDDKFRIRITIDIDGTLVIVNSNDIIF